MYADKFIPVLNNFKQDEIIQHNVVRKKTVIYWLACGSIDHISIQSKCVLIKYVILPYAQGPKKLLFKLQINTYPNPTFSLLLSQNV